MDFYRKRLLDAKRIVIKVGTSTLTYDNGRINIFRIEKLARVLADFGNQGKELVLVTSGAVGVGVGKLKMKEYPKSMMEKQAVAAVGQSELMHIYSKFFSEFGHIVGQILLTKDVVDEPKRRENVVNTFETLLAKGIIPIVNENDSVSIEQLEDEEKKVFGDNDTLAAIVSEIVDADLLIILSDIDGFYDSDPNTNPESKKISYITEITDEIESSATGAGTKRGTGGMATKILAAKITSDAGVDLVIANGQDPAILRDILNGEDIGTIFVSKHSQEVRNGSIKE